MWNWERNRAAPALWQIPKIIQFLGYSPYTPCHSLSGRLKAYRQARGLSQKKLAKALGVDRSTLAEWETGRSEPQGKLKERLENVLSGTAGFEPARRVTWQKGTAGVREPRSDRHEAIRYPT